ncbi:MAG: Integral rane sensor signal transduction histidine kinase, partial [Pedosphaera sp.]|nr:Integral rane sensor signal transduction histidine kinase [Pedosphaera sp.]
SDAQEKICARLSWKSGNLPADTTAFSLSRGDCSSMSARNSNLANGLVPAGRNDRRRAFWLARHQSILLRYATSIVSVLLVIAILKTLNPQLADKHPYTLFFAAVSVTSWFAGFWPSLLTILLSYLAADWFFILPRYVLNHGGNDLSGLGGFIFSGLAIAFTSRALHAARERAEAKREELSREITARARIQEELVQAKAKLGDYAATLEGKVAERTADLRESIQLLEKVLYHVAHDLRAPLRAIQSFTLLLEQNAGRLDAEGQDFAHRVVAATSRMDVLIRDLLAYGHLGQIKPSVQRVDTEGVLDAALAQLSVETVAKSAAILVRRPLPPVIANETLLRQILLNLVSNALTYVAPGIAPRIEIWAETDAGKARLSVKDNGTGIEAEYHGKVFDVFERLPSATDTSKTGMGLAIVTKAVERMKGQVGVESRPGKGSRFWVELPLAANG